MIQFWGAVLLITGCSGFGYSLVIAHRREVSMLRQLIYALQDMEWELKYHLTELPDLCRIAGERMKGPLKEIFSNLSAGLQRNEITDISGSLNVILANSHLPKRIRKNLRLLGNSLGKYDLECQLQGLEMIRQQCRKDLNELEEGGPQRLQNYQTLAFCTGLALAILFI